MFEFFAIAVAVIIVAVVVTMLRRFRRQAFINRYRFPDGLLVKFRQQYPRLSDAEVERVIHGLRDWFHICSRAGRHKMVSMPSQVVDDLWHEFILFTRHYDAFCKRALGRFLHHTPAEAMRSKTAAQDGIKRAWRLACAKERIAPKNPDRLPLLFAIDAELNIENGFHYALDCKDKKSPEYGSGYCASHIGCSSGCGGSGCGGDSGCSGGGCGGD